MHRRATVLLMPLQAWAGSSWAAGKADGQGSAQLTRGSSAKVVEVIDGDTVVLDDGKEVRLVGIQAPKLPLNRPNFKEWPLAREAKEGGEKLGLNRRVTLLLGGERTDRHGRTLAHLHTYDGTWAQGEMLS